MCPLHWGGQGGTPIGKLEEVCDFDLLLQCRSKTRLRRNSFFHFWNWNLEIYLRLRTLHSPTATRWGVCSARRKGMAEGSEKQKKKLDDNDVTMESKIQSAMLSRLSHFNQQSESVYYAALFLSLLMSFSLLTNNSPSINLCFAFNAVLWRLRGFVDCSRKTWDCRNLLWMSIRGLSSRIWSRYPFFKKIK